MRIYNSLTRKIEEFTPLDPPNVSMYSCGPTVYWNQHIGHMRRYVGDDLLKRVLKFNGYKVKQVMNITDVGHLISDADEGEDKMEKGARKSGKTVWEVAKVYEEQFLKSLGLLNIELPDTICRATDHIEEQIALIKKLEQKGYTYKTERGVYFDISKFKNYAELSGQKLDQLKVKSRADVVEDLGKRNPLDFALWVFTVGIHKDHTMCWPSPWGEGFPGWHIECSAMSMKYLGETIDIHTGGIDHIPIHHTNEIAQSEAATGKQFVRFWIHHEFLQVSGQKMSKSLGNLFTVEDVENRGIDTLSLRYLFLTTHYRSPLNFTWESLKGAENALKNLRSQLDSLRSLTSRTVLSVEKNSKIDDFADQFKEALNQDLNSPQALAVLWEMLKSNIPGEDKYDLAISFDEVLGLNLAKILGSEFKIPVKIQKLLERREKLRQAGKFAEADAVRVKISDLGFKIQDSSDGVNVIAND